MTQALPALFGEPQIDTPLPALGMCHRKSRCRRRHTHGHLWRHPPVVRHSDDHSRLAARKVAALHLVSNERKID
jgi:hypothetical protein